MKGLGSIRKISFAMKNTLRHAVLKNPLQKCQGGAWVGQDFGPHDPACPAEAVGVAVQGHRQKAPADPGNGQRVFEVLPEVQELNGRDWASVMFSDEPTFRILNSRGLL